MRLRGAGGNEDAYYAERIGLAREALYRRQIFVYQGDLYTGKVVFHPLHPDVRAVEVHIPDIVLRVDRFDRPTETVDATFHFQVSQGAVPADSVLAHAPTRMRCDRRPHCSEPRYAYPHQVAPSASG